MSELEVVAREAYEAGYVDGQNNPNGYSSKEQRDSCVASLLSQQAEPVDTAPAQDELEAFDAWYATEEAFAAGDSNGWYGIARAAWMARADRPAQTEQQPSAYLRVSDLERLSPDHVAGCAASLSKEPGDGRVAIYAAPQPEPSGLDPHAIAQQVREALDRQACPNAWMVITYEATVTALSATPSSAKRGDA